MAMAPTRGFRALASVSGWGIRAQLLALAAAALVPLLLLVAWSVHDYRSQALTQLRFEAEHHARQVAVVLDDHLHFVEGVLAAVTPLAATKGGSIPATELETIMRYLPGYATNILVVDFQGRVLASFLPISPDLRARGITDRPYFRRALGSPGMVVSEPIVGKITGTRVVNSAMAYRDPEGNVLGVVVLTTNLARLEELAVAPLTPAHITVGIFHSSGETVLLSREGVGAAELEALRESTDEAEFVGRFSRPGIEEAFATVALTRAPWRAAAATYAQGTSIKAGAIPLIVSIVAALLSVTLAVWLAHRITQPLRVLREATVAIAEGNLAYRTRALPGEVGAVGRAFNRMAEQIERQREMLRADEQRFRAAFHHSPLAMIISSFDEGVVLEVNAAFCKLRQLEPREAIGRTTAQIGLWDDPQSRDRAWEVLHKNGRIEGFESRLLTGEGATIDTLLFAESLMMDGRRVVMTQAVDITESRRAQRLLAESEEWMRSVFRLNPLPMTLSSMETRRLVEVNDAFLSAIGYSTPEVLNGDVRTMSVWVVPADRERFYDLVESEGRVAGFVARLKTRSGDFREMLMYGERLMLDERPMVLVQAVDVTERLQSQRQLADITHRLALATRNAHIGIWDLDLQTDRLDWDDTCFEQYGADKGQFGGRGADWLALLHPDDRQSVRQAQDEMSAGTHDGQLQFRIVRPDGQVRHIRAAIHVERDLSGTAVRFVGTNSDVTEQVLAREALSRANADLETRVVERTAQLQATVQELEAFSYTVAHDLRAPLRAIDGFSSYLAQAMEPVRDEGATTLIAKVRRNVASMERLIDGLLHYARLGRQGLAPVAVDMGALVAQVRGELAEIHRGVEFVLGELPSAQGDPDMLRQVWTNLMGNACKFSSTQARPRVEVGFDADARAYFVRDNGVGFDMRFADRLFRVFERLHSEPEFAGTGVGLALVNRVVQRHGGSAWADSIPGNGATFHFQLPKA